MSVVSAPTKMRTPQEINGVILRRVMPLLIGAYIMAFLDRTNIGMAKDRLEIDLGISATAYGIGAGLFFLTYALSEIPSNLIMHKVGARFWIMRIMITWGIISAGMAFVQGEWSFYIMRMLLGVAEAGLFPGVMYFLTQWFVVKDRAKANGMFLLGVSIANIVGAPLGGLLLTMDGLGGLHGWQWMFIVEGLPGLRPGLRGLEEAPGPPTAGDVPHRRGSRRSRGPHRRRGDRRRRGLRQPPAPRRPEGQADPARRRRLLHPPDRRLRPVLLPALHHRHLRQAQPAADRPADGHPVDLLRGRRPAGPPLRHRRPPLPDAGHRHHDRHRRRLRPRRRRRPAARA